MEDGKAQIGAESCLRIGRELESPIEQLRTRDPHGLTTGFNVSRKSLCGRLRRAIRFADRGCGPATKIHAASDTELTGLRHPVIWG